MDLIQSDGDISPGDSCGDILSRAAPEVRAKMMMLAQAYSRILSRSQSWKALKIPSLSWFHLWRGEGFDTCNLPVDGRFGFFTLQPSTRSLDDLPRLANVMAWTVASGIIPAWMRKEVRAPK